MRKTIVFCLIGALCALVVAFVAVHCGDSSGDESAGDDASVADVRKGIRSQKPSIRSTARRQSRSKPVLDFGADDGEDEDDKRTPEEKALAERIEKALDDDNLEAAIACADEAQKCGVVEIRQAMVDTLGWFGEKALPELMPFLADADEDVRDSAKSEWSMAISSIEDDAEKIGVVELAMGVLNDEDTLEDISGEYIGIDEKMAVESLARIIAEGKSSAGVEKAKETYEFVTGEEWAGAEEAARWIAEEYEPPGAE